MKKGILRGFDFLHTDLKERLRFCNPIVSFAERIDAPIYLARRLEWYCDNENERECRWLTPLARSAVGSFGTSITGESRSIQSGEGVVVIGANFATAAANVGIDLEHSQTVVFTKCGELSCRIGIANVSTFNSFVRELTDKASAVCESEIVQERNKEISDRARAALFVLRNCSTTPVAVLAKYELLVAYVCRNHRMYERLLDRFEIELDRDRARLKENVHEHVEGIFQRRGRSSERHDKTVYDVSGSYADVMELRAILQKYSEMWRSFQLPRVRLKSGMALFLQGSFPMTTSVRTIVPSGEQGARLPSYMAAVGSSWVVEENPGSTTKVNSPYGGRVYKERAVA